MRPAASRKQVQVRRKRRQIVSPMSAELKEVSPAVRFTLQKRPVKDRRRADAPASTRVVSRK